MSTIGVISVLSGEEVGKKSANQKRTNEQTNERMNEWTVFYINNPGVTEELDTCRQDTENEIKKNRKKRKVKEEGEKRN